jgi:hypothetical protein
VTGKKNAPELREFYRRCEARGVQESFIKTLDIARTKAVRSIGNGSYANRLVALRELQSIAGSFDDVGRKNLTRDIVSTRVGHDLADRYAPVLEEGRPTIDSKIAFLENQQLSAGNPVPVVSTELHAAHLAEHIPALTGIIEQLDVGQADPMAALPALQAFYEHIALTAEQIAGDPLQEGLVGQAKQALQYAEEMINNTSKQVQKMQREAAEAGEAGPEGAEGADPALEAKMQEHQVKMQITQQKAELDMQIKQAKFEQEQALRDAETAMELQELQ